MCVCVCVCVCVRVCVRVLMVQGRHVRDHEGRPSEHAQEVCSTCVLLILDVR